MKSISKVGEGDKELEKKMESEMEMEMRLEVWTYVIRTGLIER